MAFIALTAIPAVVSWAQEKFGAMYYPKVTRASFWVMHVAFLVLATAVPLAFSLFSPPTRYVEYPAYFERLNYVSTAAAIISMLYIMLLTGTAIWSFARAWRER